MFLQLVGQKVVREVEAFDPIGEVYGVARSIIALGTALLVLFAPLDDFRFAGVIGLLIVASGWQPRFTGFLHAGIAFVLQASHVEGGRTASLLALLLLPIAVLDDRTWHWTRREPRYLGSRERIRRLVARSCFVLLRVQIAIFYLQAAFAQTRLPSPEWTILAGEWILGAAILSSRRTCNIALAFGASLHFGLALAHGGWPMAITMMGALVLYLRPLDQPFTAWFEAGEAAECPRATFH